ncbi:MAG: hypothetical protein JW893_08615, partial [Candidatus Omnitrophica bacterium]|nr:hypothetical protein [Candidatus Omnitrophota bacterium]
MMRTIIFQITIFLGLTTLGGGLFQTQVLNGEHYQHLSERNRIRLIPLEATRGRVFDSRGKLLATNRAAYNVIATPEDLRPEVFSLLAELLDLSPQEIRKRVSAPREYPFAPAVVMEDISRELAFQIEERKPELPGVSIEVASLRYYPYGEIASHVVGYIGKVNRHEFESHDRSRVGMNSYIGRAGLERIYD